jgi:acetyl-CoA carboxylase carboxyl transferase subunit beta
MEWFKKIKPNVKIREKKVKMPEGLWVKCDSCKEIVYKQELEKNLSVCPKCNYHFRISARQRIEQLADPGTFVEHDQGVASMDPLKFKDSKRYRDRLKESMSKTGLKEAVICGQCEIGGIPCQLCVMEFGFLGGSMASAVGEKITRAIERATEQEMPLIIVSISGGARMQEGILSLMQMAKASSALARLNQKGIPFISVCADPTTGGVSASYAMLGDLIFAEPGALIGFAGPRVIEQTILQKLPEGFQRAEFLLEHGMIDKVVDRRELKETIVKALRFFRAEPVGEAP